MLTTEEARPLLDNAESLLGAAWHVLGAAAELGPEPRNCQLLGRQWWISCSASGSGPELRAVDDQGESPWGVQARYGLVWLAPLEPPTALPVLPEFEDPAFSTGIITQRTRVSAGVMIDNFLDVSHFSYLHRGTFGRAVPVTTAGLAVERDGWTVRLQHSTDLHLTEETEPVDALTESWRVATYTVLAPFVTHLQMDFPATGEHSAATLLCQPETPTMTTVNVMVAWPAADPVGFLEQMELSRAVLAEDLSILELMADPRLALSLRAELNTRADRASVEYRRLLADHLSDAATRTQQRREAVDAAHR